VFGGGVYDGTASMFSANVETGDRLYPNQFVCESSDLIFGTHGNGDLVFLDVSAEEHRTLWTAGQLGEELMPFSTPMET